MSQRPPDAGQDPDALSPDEPDEPQEQPEEPPDLELPIEGADDQLDESALDDAEMQPPADLELPIEGAADQLDDSALDDTEMQPPADLGSPEDAPPSSQPDDGGPAVVARYGLMRQTGMFGHDLGSPLAVGANLVIRTERGVELGEVIANVSDRTCYGYVARDDLAGYLAASGAEGPLKQIGRALRLANAQDVIDHRHLQSSAHEEAAFCKRQIRELALKMKLVSVEHLLGGERIIFNFSSEVRIDFRELVRRLAHEYRTRIEMRQVGARDEARLLADYERCGQPCCCQQFIKDLKPVSMRMAKIQKATLDPAKISGRCGRLMCCLRFEDACYEELRAILPKKNTWVQTDEYVGRVVDTQTLTQMVSLELIDKTKVVVANEEIRQRDVPPPKPPVQAVGPDRQEPQAEQARPWSIQPEDVGPEDAELEEALDVPPGSPEGQMGGESPASAPSLQEGKPADLTSQPGTGKKRRRRRPRRGGPKAPSAGPQGPAADRPQASQPQPAAQGQGPQQQGASPKPQPHRRGRRKRRRH
jgi:cell fate regulator YaaT (PSP1 superfamily)